MKYLAGLILACVSFVTSANIFYKIETTDATHPPAYLFGTMHMLCQEDFELPAAVMQAFQETQQLIVEVDLTSQQQQMQLQKQIQQQPSDYLKQALTPEQYGQLSSAFQTQLNYPLTSVESMRPFVLSAMLLQSYLNCNEQPLSLDELFMDAALAKSKSIIGLETITKQLSLFDQIPLPDQVAELLDLALKQAESKQEIQALTTTYLTADGEQIYELIKKQEDFKNYQSLILDDRNLDWLKLLPQLVNSNPSFIAVGAGHLAGPKGLVNLLRTEGFIVTPIPIQLVAQ